MTTVKIQQLILNLNPLFYSETDNILKQIRSICKNNIVKKNIINAQIYFDIQKYIDSICSDYLPNDVFNKLISLENILKKIEKKSIKTYACTSLQCIAINLYISGNNYSDPNYVYNYNNICILSLGSNRKIILSNNKIKYEIILCHGDFLFLENFSKWKIEIPANASITDIHINLIFNVSK